MSTLQNKSPHSQKCDDGLSLKSVFVRFCLSRVLEDFYIKRKKTLFINTHLLSRMINVFIKKDVKFKLNPRLNDVLIQYVNILRWTSKQHRGVQLSAYWYLQDIDHVKSNSAHVRYDAFVFQLWQFCLFQSKTSVNDSRSFSKIIQDRTLNCLSAPCLKLFTGWSLYKKLNLY